jgi:DNA-binding NtrC family response regulator
MKKKILIIDDVKNIKMMISKVLEADGYDVDLADNGVDGIRLFQENNYDLVLLDIRMPGMSGTEVLRVLKELKENILVVIITAYPTVKNAVECIKQGAVDYLRKPFTADKIRQFVRQIIDRKGMSNENLNTYESCIEYAKKCINEKNFDEAVKFLKKAITYSIDNSEAFNLMGNISELKNELTSACKYYNIALQLEPYNEGILENIKRIRDYNL